MATVVKVREASATLGSDCRLSSLFLMGPRNALRTTSIALLGSLDTASPDWRGSRAEENNRRIHTASTVAMRFHYTVTVN